MSILPALQCHCASFRHILGLGTLYLGLKLLIPGVEHGQVSDGGGVLHGQLVLHLEVHGVTDLGQGVDTALVPAAVHHLGAVDDQSPIISIDLRPWASTNVNLTLKIL